MSACDAGPSGSKCIASALADINAARASEGVGAMVLPSNFASLTIPQQLLIVSDLERIGRGLTPILGLAAPLDADAQQGAVAGGDPVPTSFTGDAWGSNWEGGYASTLEADFGWMYDDGPGSENLDCAAAGDPGCWGHRDNILRAWDAPLVMGAGYTPNGQYGASMTELFMGGDTETAPGQSDAPLTPAGYSPTSGSTGGSGSTGSGSGSTTGSGSGSTGASPSPQVMARVGPPHLVRGRLVFIVTLIHGRGTIRATAARGRRVITLRVVRRGSRFTVSGRLPHGRWTVRVVLSGGSRSAAATSTFKVLL